jgi:hypothetical protein
MLFEIAPLVGKFVAAKSEDNFSISNRIKQLTQQSSAKDEINALVQRDYELGSCTIALLSNSSSKCPVDLKLLAEYKPPKRAKAKGKLKECWRSDLTEMMLYNKKYSDFVESNKGKEDGWVRNECFEHKKSPKYLSHLESAILSIHLCLALRDRIQLDKVSKMWGIDNRSIRRHRKKLKENFEEFPNSNVTEEIAVLRHKKQPNQLPLLRLPQSPLPKAVSPSSPSAGGQMIRKFFSPSKAKHQRSPRTPFFSPSTKPSSLKKARRKSLGLTILTTIHQEVDLVTANDSVEVVISPLAGDDSSAHSIDVIASPLNENIITLNDDMNASPSEQDVRRVTPTEEEDAFDFSSVAENIEQNPSTECDELHDNIRNSYTPQRIPNRSKKPNLANILSKDDYPILTGGSNKLSDVRKVFEESAQYLGFDFAVKAMEKSNEAIVLTVPSRGAPKTFVEVPKSSTIDRFNINAKRKRWIELVLKTAGKDLDDDHVAAAMVVYLIKNFPSAIPIAMDCNLPILDLNDRMDPHTSAAMWHEANLPKRGQRVIKRYIFAYFGFWITSPEYQIDALTKHYVRSIHGKVEIGDVAKEEITFWYRKVDDVVKNLLDNDWIGVEFDEIHVVFGGDHGQSVFGAAVKIMLYNKAGVVLKYAVEKVGHIDCKKDTYEVLLKTIAKPLNDSLQRLKESFLFVPNPIDVTTETYESDSDSSRSDESFRQVYLVPNTEELPETTDRMYNIKLLAVGDLAFVSMALGKINMGGKWCHLCDLAPKEWKKIDHEAGEDMTLQRMEEIRSAIGNLEVADIPSNRIGCVAVPLFRVFQPWDWIIPCLHVMMGAMNDAFVAWLKYIDERHECIPPKEREARDSYWDALNSLHDMEDDFKDWKERKEPHLTELQESVNEYSEKRKQRNRNTRSTTTKFFYSLEQRKSFESLIQGWKEQIKQIKKVEKPIREKKIKEQQSRSSPT